MCFQIKHLIQSKTGNRRVPASSCKKGVADFGINRKKLVSVYEINKKLRNIYMRRIYARSYRIEFKISNISCVDF